MKNVFIVIAMFATHLSIAQQEPPLPPTPPSTSSSVSITSNSSQGESTSISISHDNDSYKLRAKFSENRYDRLKKLIEKELGGKNMLLEKGYSKWSNDEKVYEVKLTKRSLRISVDLEVASPDLAEKIKDLGEDVKMIISGSNVNSEKLRLQREADRKRREADRMQREAERLERQVMREARRVEQQVERDAQRIERDAARIEREAKRLDREAKRVEERARHSGGVSNYIQRLLEDPKTKYVPVSGGKINWIWPELQENLLAQLKKDALVENTNEVTFTIEKNRMYVNGSEFTQVQYAKYNKMFLDAGMQSNTDFSFYKKEDHIVIVGLNARIKKVFNDLYKKGYIDSTDEPVKLLINGNSINHNGRVLSQSKLASFNAILRDNGIIPAPGKYIEMKKAGSYRLGYTLGSNGNVGTWIEEDR